MASWISLGILLLVLAAIVTSASDQLFDVNVNFKPNSSRLLEISFDRQDPFSVIDQSAVGNTISHKCFLQKDGLDLGQFVQNGPDNVAPFTISQPYEPCEPMQKLSIRCEIELYQATKDVRSAEFEYDGSQGFLNYHCDKNVFYAITIGKNY